MSVTTCIRLASCQIKVLLFALTCAVPLFAFADDKPRARDIGIPFAGTPGPYNAITDVAGVTVGHFFVVPGGGVAHKLSMYG